MRFKKPEQILDMYNIQGKDREFLLNKTDFKEDCPLLFDIDLN